MDYDSPRSDNRGSLSTGHEDGDGVVWGRIWLVLRFAAVTAYVLLIAIGLATAQITDHLSFKIEKRVIVWSGVPGNALHAAELQGQLRPLSVSAPVAPLPVISGQLVSQSWPKVHAVSDSGLQSAFFVASNAAFNIKAHWVGDDPAAARVTMRMGLDVSADGYGRAAQHPAPLAADGGFSASSWQLAELAAPRIIFEGQRKTAARPGAVVDQSVKFNAQFSSNSSAADIDRAAGEVVFTVYCP